MLEGSVVIGDRSDLHVQAVLESIAAFGGPTPLVFDAPMLTRTEWHLDADILTVEDRSVNLGTCRGWLRRYAPALWGAGNVTGSLDSLTQRAFLSLVGSVARVEGITWLTDLDSLLTSEDRIHQLFAAARTGARIPRWVVTSDSSDAVDTLGPRFVVKPLVGGYWSEPGGSFAVYAEVLESAEAAGIDMRKAPFMAQQVIEARQHLRVVTVGDRSWCGAIEAEGRPLDWREQEQAHHDWKPVADAEACGAARALARHLAVGYSSQDWIRDDDGIVFLDFNPGGQWLFLPDDISGPVTDEIAKFLTGRPR